MKKSVVVWIEENVEFGMMVGLSVIFTLLLTLTLFILIIVNAPWRIVQIPIWVAGVFLVVTGVIVNVKQKQEDREREDSW